MAGQQNLENKSAKETKAVDENVAKAAGITKEYFDEQGAKSLENKRNGGEEVKVSLTNKTIVEFTEDFGYFKKGHIQEVSDVALAIYEKKKVIKKV